MVVFSMSLLLYNCNLTYGKQFSSRQSLRHNQKCIKNKKKHILGNKTYTPGFLKCSLIFNEQHIMNIRSRKLKNIRYSNQKIPMR